RFKKQIYSELQKKGASKNSIDVKVLNAYKQGFSWLNEEIIPKLKGKDIGHIDITYHNLKHSKKIKWQQLASSTRWLQELYPIDGEFTRKLGIADSLIQFHTTYQESPIYKISVSNSKGEVIFTDEFNP